MFWAMKQILYALALTACAPAAWAADKLSLTEVSSYLNGLKTAQASFTQINDDGSLSTGKLFMHRPGKMRFEYDGPDAGVVVAGAGAVVIFDPKSNQRPETYPLRRTPLSVILARNVDLGRANMVVGHSFDGTATIVRAQDPEHPEYGSIDLMFTDSPVQLRKWVINDDAGGQTTVVLGALETGVKLSSRLFDTELNKNER